MAFRFFVGLLLARCSGFVKPEYTGYPATNEGGHFGRRLPMVESLCFKFLDERNIRELNETHDPDACKG